jgi:hypothetical protein
MIFACLTRRQILRPTLEGTETDSMTDTPDEVLKQILGGLEAPLQRVENLERPIEAGAVDGAWPS